jgi:hypothetical protein
MPEPSRSGGSGPMTMAQLYAYYVSIGRLDIFFAMFPQPS